MKVDATCPVCKIPYHRREIRGSPHMDSLVSIYKSMEDASGVSIFASQDKTSPSEKEVKAASIQKASDKNRQGSGKGRASKRKECKKTKETDVDAPGPIVMNSSQTKKRVQLLQNPSSKSLTKSSEPAEKTVIGLGDHPGPNEVGNLSLSPFFWLRDENERENLSQLAGSDQLLDITPLDVPSFSDLKDSDHESLSKADEQETRKPGDMFDSEMFEWTQRPSSPEILPSPAKAKVLGRGKIDLTQRKLSKAIASKCRKRKSGSARNAVAGLHAEVSQEDHMESSAGANIGEKQDCCGASIMKDGNPDENVKVKRATRNKGLKEEADKKQGTKRKISNVKSPPVQPVAGDNELQEDHMESSEPANIVEKQDCRGASDTSIKKDGNPQENVKVRRATRSKGQSSGVQSGLNISKEADGKQGTKRKRSSVKLSTAHAVAGSKELSLGTEIVGKGDQNGAHGSSNPQPEKQTPAEKSPLKKRRRKSNANSSPKDVSEKTEKKTSEKR